MKIFLSIRKRIIISFVLVTCIFIIPGLFGVYKAIYSITGLFLGTALIVIFFALFIYLIFELIFIKSIIKVLSNIEGIKGSEADLTWRLPVNQNDEIGRFSRDYNIFIAKIHNIIFKLKNSIDESITMSQNLASNTVEMASSSEEIASTMDSITSREMILNKNIKVSQKNIEEIRNSIEKIVESIEKQSVSVERSSAAIEQTIASIDNINRISESKIEFIKSLDQLAIEGEKDMSKTLESIKEIAKSADLIKSLITVINKVASQTNMLAMNAAIEAAHAGKYGKGFGIVADEIRKLAEATAKNAKNIGANLKTIIIRIDDSNKLTEKTDKTIKTMTGGIKDVSDSMVEIATGLKEMAAGTTEVTASLGDLIKITEEVKEDSIAIENKSEDINKSMSDVIGISEETMLSMEEFATGIHEITEATNLVAKIGTENSENISIIENEISKFKIVDISNLKSSDGQLLIQWNRKQKIIPPRPDNPENYPEEDAMHWYDMEYAGWNIKKKNIPVSLADGADGKTIILLESSNHPYHIAYRNGCLKITDAFGVKLKTYNAAYSPENQAKQVELAIKERPELIILTPTSVNLSTEWFRKINNAGIPVIGSNTLPEDEGFKYILAWTGPDDWGQYRLLAKKFAKMMKNDGGYCILRHIEGNSNYFSRTFAVTTELNSIAPNMKCLDMISAVKPEDTKRVAAEWISRFGTRLKGITSSDPGDSIIGVCEAVKEAGRNDIIVFSSGNSKVTQDAVKAGEAQAITFQSAEADGALAVEIAIDWFNGIEIPPIRYLSVHIITKEDVEDYYPAQW